MLSLVRKRARGHNLRVAELAGRGKGSHTLYLILDARDEEVGRFAMTGHSREMSWTVMNSIEQTLTPLFGEKWTEDR